MSLPFKHHNNMMWIYHWFLVRGLKTKRDFDGVKVLESNYVQREDSGLYHPNTPASFVFKYGLFND